MNFLIGIVIEAFIWKVENIAIHLDFNWPTDNLLLGYRVDKVPESQRLVVEYADEDLVLVDEAGVDQWICKSGERLCCVIDV